MRSSQNKTRRIALSGLLFALTMALSFAESAIAPMLGLMPGVKIGLANIVVMYALFFMGAKQALSLALLKSFFVMLTRGVVAGFLSLCVPFVRQAHHLFYFVRLRRSGSQHRAAHRCQHRAQQHIGPDLRPCAHRFRSCHGHGDQLQSVCFAACAGPDGL